MDRFVASLLAMTATVSPRLGALGHVRVPMCAVGLAAPVGVRAVGRQIDHVAVAHAALGDDAVGELLHVGALALEHGDFETAFVVEMHVQCGVREIVAVVEVAGEPLRQFARLVVVHVDQRGDARPRTRDFGRRLLQARSGRGRASPRSGWHSRARP